jgi:predicted outer membrane protein
VRVPRWLTVSVLAVILAGFGLAVWRYWETTPTSAAPGQQGWVSTKAGPLGAADRDFITRVRLAGLWEHPVGQEAEDRAQQPRVREIGKKISDEHSELDAITIQLARDLGVVLPNQPTDQQKEWMSEISAQSGTNYDVRMVNLLRQAHGTILPAIAQVRAGTRNEDVRKFADTAYTYVNRHIGYLESTGLVNFDTLPEPPAPTAAVVTPQGKYENLPLGMLAMAVLGIAIVGTILTLVLVRGPKPRSSASREQDSGHHAQPRREPDHDTQEFQSLKTPDHHS